MASIAMLVIPRGWRIHWVSTMAPDLRQVFARIRPGPRRCKQNMFSQCTRMTIFYMIYEQNWTNTSMYAYIYNSEHVFTSLYNIYYIYISHIHWFDVPFVCWRTELWRRPNLPGGSLRPVGRWWWNHGRWIGWRENLHRKLAGFPQETSGFSCKCSLNPVKWVMKNQTNCDWQEMT